MLIQGYDADLALLGRRRRFRAYSAYSSFGDFDINGWLPQPADRHTWDDAQWQPYKANYDLAKQKLLAAGNAMQAIDSSAPGYSNLTNTLASWQAKLTRDMGAINSAFPYFISRGAGQTATLNLAYQQWLKDMRGAANQMTTLVSQVNAAWQKAQAAAAAQAQAQSGSSAQGSPGSPGSAVAPSIDWTPYLIYGGIGVGALTVGYVLYRVLKPKAAPTA